MKTDSAGSCLTSLAALVCFVLVWVFIAAHSFVLAGCAILGLFIYAVL